MPSSRPSYIVYVCNAILSLQPKSILDIGVGFGKWGYLAREYTDIWNGRYHMLNWETRIDGIEAFPEYITGIQRSVYDDITIGDASLILPTLKDASYDLILCLDVIEHLEKERGKELYRHITRVGNNWFMATPKNPTNQGAVNGNEYETHRSKWEVSDFPYSTVADDNYGNYLAYKITR